MVLKSVINEDESFSCFYPICLGSSMNFSPPVFVVRGESRALHSRNFR